MAPKGVSLHRATTRTLTMTALVAASGWCRMAAAATLNVPGDYPTIQAAIDAASNGDVVLVADGVYTGPGNRDIDFGGRLITVRSANGPETCIIDCQGTLDDPHRGFHFHNGETAAAVLDGFTIRYGSVGNAYYTGAGGGISCSNCSPTIANCVITFCSAHAHDYGGSGGGISSSGSPTFLNCVISSNAAQTWGGGISCIGSPVFIGCTISSNGSGSQYFGGSGGGVLAWAGSTVTMIDCDIIGNGSGSGGGVYAAGGSLINCRVIANSAIYSGGGLITSGLVANCLIAGNSAPLGGGGLIGGGLVGNDGGSGVAGGISMGGSAAVINCTVVGNSAETGGGIVAPGGAPSLGNSIVWANVATQGPQIAVGSPHQGGTVLTVAFCDVQSGQSGVFVEPGSEVVWGPGNIDADPLFADMDGRDGIPGSLDDDLRLRAGSPCIDAGDVFAVPAESTTDLAGIPRRVDDPYTPDCPQAPGQCGAAPVVDMGAFEHHVPCPWDLDYSGEVDVLDLAGLLAAWGTEPAGPPDFNHDGSVGIIDFLLLLAHWGACCGPGDGTLPDCNDNGYPDECDLESGESDDCNGNGISDDCDLESGESDDCNGNGIGKSTACL